MNPKKMLYVLTSGSESPKRAYAALLLATAAASAGDEATVYFITGGVSVIEKGEAERTRLGDLPPLELVLREAVEAGVRLEACEESCMLLGLVKGDLVEDVRIVGATSLNDMAADADAVLTF